MSREDEAVRDLKKALARDALQYGTDHQGRRRANSEPRLRLLHDPHLEPDSGAPSSGSARVSDGGVEDGSGSKPSQEDTTSSGDMIPLLPHARTVAGVVGRGGVETSAGGGEFHEAGRSASGGAGSAPEPRIKRHGFGPTKQVKLAIPGGFRRHFVLQRREQQRGGEERRKSGSMTPTPGKLAQLPSIPMHAGFRESGAVMAGREGFLLPTGGGPGGQHGSRNVEDGPRLSGRLSASLSDQPLRLSRQWSHGSLGDPDLSGGGSPAQLDLLKPNESQGTITQSRLSEASMRTQRHSSNFTRRISSDMSLPSQLLPARGPLLPLESVFAAGETVPESVFTAGDEAFPVPVSTSPSLPTGDMVVGADHENAPPILTLNGGEDAVGDPSSSTHNHVFGVSQVLVVPDMPPLKTTLSPVLEDVSGTSEGAAAGGRSSGNRSQTSGTTPSPVVGPRVRSFQRASGNTSIIPRRDSTATHHRRPQTYAEVPLMQQLLCPRYAFSWLLDAGRSSRYGAFSSRASRVSHASGRTSRRVSHRQPPGPGAGSEAVSHRVGPGGEAHRLPTVKDVEDLEEAWIAEAKEQFVFVEGVPVEEEQARLLDENGVELIVEEVRTIFRHCRFGGGSEDSVLTREKDVFLVM